MAKVKTKHVCQNCGYETAGYLGRCPECGSWGSFVEEVSGDKTPQSVEILPDNTPPKRLSEIEMDSEIRVSTGISEFDRVLGGGIVQGSLVIIAVDPGIGKSTILVQTSGALCKSGKKVLYISAEESSSQIKLRAERLGVQSDTLYIYPQTHLDLIKKHILEMQPDLVIVDILKAIFTSLLQCSAGGVSQIREC